METKNFTVKAPAEGHTFEGYASTWTRQPDSYGDVVAKGAFADTIKALRESGKSIPVLWSHEYYDPKSFVAKVVEIEEDDHGLRVKGEFFDDPESQKVHTLIKERVVSEMSFAFDIEDSGTVEESGVEVRELRKLKLFEVSIVMFGANSDTSIETVKAVADRFTSEEIAALKEVAAQNVASRGDEVAGKPNDGEAQQRAKEITERFTALRGEEGVTK